MPPLLTEKSECPQCGREVLHPSDQAERQLHMSSCSGRGGDSAEQAPAAAVAVAVVVPVVSAPQEFGTPELRAAVAPAFVPR